MILNGLSFFSPSRLVAHKHHRKPPMAPGPPPPPPPPPPDIPPPPEDIPMSRPAWRSVQPRSTRSRKRQGAPPPPPPQPVPEPRQHSWAMWQREFGRIWDSYSGSMTDVLILQLILTWRLPRRPLNPLCLFPTGQALACSVLVHPVIRTTVRCLEPWMHRTPK